MKAHNCIVWAVLRAVRVLIITGCTWPLVANADTAALSASSTSPSDLGEIIVTAQKRSENIQTVPVSITVLSEKTLADQQLVRVEDMAALVPGMSYQNFGAGQNIITLRGVTSGPQQLSNATAVYVDDIPFGSSNADSSGSLQTGDFDTFDMSRVEVLQGPQGTLYGANAIGGLVKYVTNAPDPKAFDAIVNVGGVYTEDGGAGYSVKGMVNLPVSDDAAFRLTAFSRRDPAFIDDNGMYPRSNVNQNEFSGGRVGFLWTPTDRLTIRLTGFSQSIASEGTSIVDLNPTTLKPLYGDLEQHRLVPEPINTHYNLGAATVSYDMDWATLSSTTSYSEFKFHQFVDYTGYFSSAAPSYGLTSDEIATPALEDSRTERTTEELRLTSKTGGPLDWQIGGYYDLESSFFNFNVTADTLVPVRQALVGVLPVFVTDNPSTYRDLAAFGDVDYHFSSKMDLQLGARESFNYQAFSANESPAAANGDIVSRTEGTSSDNAFTFLASPRWNITDNSMVYARVAKGFRAGGPNALPAGAPTTVPQTFKPDSLVSYELGAKTTWPDLARLTVDASVYHIIWTNIQMETTVDGLGAAVNASKALIDGVQFVASVQPVQGLSVAFDMGYQHARLAEDALIIGGVAGDHLPTVPLFNGALTADYRWTLTGPFTARVGATYRYTDDEVSDFQLNGDQYKIPVLQMLDFRAGVEMGRSSVNVVVKNLTNQLGYSTIAPGPAAVYGYRVPPRTIGVYFQREFN